MEPNAHQSADGVSSAHSTGETQCEIAVDIASPAVVAKASASQPVSPAISLAAPSLQQCREQPKTETPSAPLKSSNQSGSQRQTLKPNCYECKYRRDLPGSAHSQCGHPEALYSAKRFMVAALTEDMTGSGSFEMDSGTLKIAANKHGIRSGWFMWPFNFDPIWLEKCSGY